jgi:tellurite methyltransferase
VAAGDRERWDRKHADVTHDGEAPEWLTTLDAELPREGRALDVAAGTGAMALYFAARGMRATAIDVSPVALGRCRERAAAAGLEVETMLADLEGDPLPSGPWDVIACRHYLQRDVFPRLIAALAPGGVLVAEIATRRNLEHHAHPAARYLLDVNELLSLVRPLEVAYYREGLVCDRQVACVLARRPS